jgi:hypothetical protein
MEEKGSKHELEDQPLPVLEEGDQVTAQECRGWAAMQQVFRRHFMARVGASPDLAGTSWERLPVALRGALRESIKENPRFGPELGLMPSGLVYPTGETFAQAVARKTRDRAWQVSSGNLSGLVTQWQ